MEENNQPVVADSAAEQKTEGGKQHLLKIRWGVTYLAFCAAIFMIWQFIGVLCMGFDRSGYSIGYSNGYLFWSSFLGIIWVIGSIVIAVKSSGSRLRDF